MLCCVQVQGLRRDEMPLRPPQAERQGEREGGEHSWSRDTSDQHTGFFGVSPSSLHTTIMSGNKKKGSGKKGAAADRASSSSPAPGSAPRQTLEDRVAATVAEAHMAALRATQEKRSEAEAQERRQSLELQERLRRDREKHDELTRVQDELTRLKARETQRDIEAARAALESEKEQAKKREQDKTKEDKTKRTRVRA